MVDLDRSLQFSKTITVSFEKGANYVTVENPAINGEFKVTTNMKNPNFKLFNRLGQNVEFKMNITEKNGFILKLNNPVSGVYFLNIESNGKVKTKKLIML